MLVGAKKLKLVNAVDEAQSERLEPLYTIEIVLTVSPQRGAKCGAIVVFRTTDVPDIDMNPASLERLDTKALEALERSSEQTQVMHTDPEYFKESDGQWIPWALQRALKLFDRFNGNARIVVKSPKLRIRESISRESVNAKRSQPLKLFSVLWDIDKLLERGYQWDPWTQTVRRGRIGAEFGKR